MCTLASVYISTLHRFFYSQVIGTTSTFAISSGRRASDFLLPSHQMPKMMGMKRTSMPRGRNAVLDSQNSKRRGLRQTGPVARHEPSFSFISCSNAATVTGKTGRHTPSLPQRTVEQRIYIGLKYIYALQSVAGRHPAGRSARRRRRRNRRHSTHGLRCHHRRQTVQRLARGWGRRYKCRGGPHPSSTWRRRQW